MPVRDLDRILAEWRALEHVVDQVSDRDDAAAIRDRIDRLRGDYQKATGSRPTLEPKPPEQLTLPLRFAPYVVPSSRSE